MTVNGFFRKPHAEAQSSQRTIICLCSLRLCVRYILGAIIHRLKHGRKAKELAKAVGRLLFAYRVEGVLTITIDNGSESSQHKLITKALKGVTVYIADPYCSWQKGAIENANKLIRQYIPKGTDFSTVTETFFREIQHNINRCPRKNLIIQLQNLNSSNIFINFALACLICGVYLEYE